MKTLGSTVSAALEQCKIHPRLMLVPGQSAQIWLASLDLHSQDCPVRVQDAGVISPRLMLAGGGLYMTLNNWGLIPEADVLPLDQFNDYCAPEEPRGCAEYLHQRLGRKLRG